MIELKLGCKVWTYEAEFEAAGCGSGKRASKRIVGAATKCEAISMAFWSGERIKWWCSGCAEKRGGVKECRGAEELRLTVKDMKELKGVKWIRGNVAGSRLLRPTIGGKACDIWALEDCKIEKEEGSGTVTRIWDCAAEIVGPDDAWD